MIAAWNRHCRHLPPGVGGRVEHFGCEDGSVIGELTALSLPPVTNTCPSGSTTPFPFARGYFIGGVARTCAKSLTSAEAFTSTVWLWLLEGMY